MAQTETQGLAGFSITGEIQRVGFSQLESGLLDQPRNRAIDKGSGDGEERQVRRGIGGTAGIVTGDIDKLKTIVAKEGGVGG